MKTERLNSRDLQQLLTQWGKECVESQATEQKRQTQVAFSSVNEVETQIQNSKTKASLGMEDHIMDYLACLATPLLEGRLRLFATVRLTSVDSHQMVKYRINNNMLSTVRSTISKKSITAEATAEKNTDTKNEEMLKVKEEAAIKAKEEVMAKARAEAKEEAEIKAKAKASAKAKAKAKTTAKAKKEATAKVGDKR